MRLGIILTSRNLISLKLLPLPQHTYTLGKGTISYCYYVIIIIIYITLSTGQHCISKIGLNQKDEAELSIGSSELRKDLMS